MKKYIAGSFLISTLFTFTNTWAGGMEEYNGCRGTTEDPCIRHGYCSIQGSDWYQWVTAFRSDKSDTQGWPGLCDMVHVALVQGNCEPPMGTTNIEAFLSGNSTAQIDKIENGTLTCGGDDGGSTGGGGGGGGSNFCDTHPDHRKCQ
jgi:hypothetical protein